MKKSPVWRVMIAAVIYLVLFVLGSSSGAIHPACYAYVGAVLPLAFSFVYLYTTLPSPAIKPIIRTNPFKIAAAPKHFILAAV